jgi:serine/threonine protein kinase
MEMVSPASRHASMLPTSRNIGKHTFQGPIDRRANAIVKALITDHDTVPVTIADASAYKFDYLPKYTRMVGDPGSTGTAYKVELNSRTRPVLSRLFERLGNRVIRKPLTGIRDGTTLLVKIIPVPRGTRNWNLKSVQRDIWTSFLRMATEEAVHHWYLSSQPAIRLVHDNKVVFLHPADIAQEFYFAGSDATGGGVYVTVARMIEGTPARTTRMSSKTAASIERAVLLMHAFGVAHADAHLDNIIVSSDGSARFIDFGMSIFLPKTLRDQSVREVKKLFAGSGDTPSTSNAVDAYTNAALRQKGFRTFFNPNGKAVKYAWSLAKTPHANAARKKGWRELYEN